MTILESLPRYATDEVLDGETVCTTPEESDAHMNAIINASTTLHYRRETLLLSARSKAGSPPCPRSPKPCRVEAVQSSSKSMKRQEFP